MTPEKEEQLRKEFEEITSNRFQASTQTIYASLWNFFLEHLKGEESKPVKFAKWLKNIDNGHHHYNDETDTKSESIGFSPWDCFIDNIMTVEELYEKFNEITKPSK